MDEIIDYSKIYSVSKLGMFEKCPKSYHFSYLDPIYSKMKNDLKKLPHNIFSFQTLGKAIHNAITLFYHAPVDQRTYEQLKEFLKQTWQSEVMWNKKPPLGEWGGFKSLDEEREVYSQALVMLANFLQMAKIEPEFEYLPTQDLRRSIEDYQNLITPLSEVFDISGKFDLVMKDDDSLNIVDFKTGKEENGDQFQLRFYKVLAEENFKKTVAKASFYFLKTGHKKEFDLEKQETEKIKKEILAKINQIKTCQNFETKPSKLCKFCLFKTFCPEKEKVREIIGDIKEEEYSEELPF